MKQPPCFNCEQRHENCHSECAGYAEYRAVRDRVNKARAEDNLKQEYFSASTYKTAKYAVNRR
jgi:hypothetical protein